MLERGMKEEIECLEASNGKEALEICQNEMIHLVITDICMPLCSGLEFVEELKRTDDEMTVIIISGYENFEYAKQAVKLGVKDYIMKPIVREEFLGLVESCLADIQKKQFAAKQFYQQRRKNEQIMTEVKRDCLIGLLEGEDTGEKLRRLETLDINLNAPFLRCAVVEYNFGEEEDALFDFAVKNIVDEYVGDSIHTDFLSLTYKPGILAVIFCFHRMEDMEKIGKIFAGAVLIVEKFTRFQTTSGIGTVVFDPASLCYSFQESQSAADFKIFDDKKVFLYSDIPSGTDTVMPDDDKLLQNPGQNTEAGILGYFEKMLGAPRTRTSVNHIKKEYETLCRSCEKRLHYLSGNTAFVYKEFYRIWSSFELRKEIRRMIQYLEYSSEIHQEDNGGRLAKDIIEFTTAHVTEDIDLNYIADQFGKTPGYIGSLFRKGCNMGFNEFVTKERIRIAQNMLRDTTVSVQRVGEMCGYYNPKYFSVVFKKVTGISPKAYQKKQGDES